MNAPTAPAALEVARNHPCFNEEAHDRVGRIHLPVAPRCNIGCLFCERRVCVHLTTQHPGWTREVLSVGQAIERVRELVRQHGDEVFVVGVAGPGEPLANAATFETLALVHQEFPALIKCASTNGLLLEASLPRLLVAGVRSLTVTVNAPDAEVGGQIYGWIRHRGQIYRGLEGAEILIQAQMRGIRAALEAGLAVKANTVLVPAVNDRHVVRLAAKLRDAGVHLQNIMPLIPGGQMRGRRPPTCDELKAAREACAPVIPQFRRCEQCRADVMRFPQGTGHGTID